MKPSIYSLTRQDMIDWAEENGGEKKFRAAQIGNGSIANASSPSKK